jgi:hypothetical protein
MEKKRFTNSTWNVPVTHLKIKKSEINGAIKYFISLSIVKTNTNIMYALISNALFSKSLKGNLFCLKRIAPIAPSNKEFAWGKSPTPLNLETFGIMLNIN